MTLNVLVDGTDVYHKNSHLLIMKQLFRYIQYLVEKIQESRIPQM